MLYMHDNRQKGVLMNSYHIIFTWDPEARVWIATSEDIRGLVLESGSFDALMERVRIAVPELISLNGDASDAANLIFMLDRQERIPVYG